MPHIFRKNHAYHSRKRNAHEIQERREQSGTGRYPNRFSNSATGNKKRQQSKYALRSQAAFERQMVLLSQDSQSLFASPEQSRKRRSSTQRSSKSSSASSDHIITSTSSHPASEQTRKRRFPTRRQNISRDTSSDKEDSTSHSDEEDSNQVSHNSTDSSSDKEDSTSNSDEEDSTSNSDASDESLPPELTVENLSYFTTRLGLEYSDTTTPDRDKKRILKQMKRIANFLTTKQMQFHETKILFKELKPLPAFTNTMKIKADYALRRFELETCTMQCECCELCHAYWITDGIITRSKTQPRKIVMKKPRHREYTWDLKSKHPDWEEVLACTRCKSHITNSMKRLKKATCEGKEIPFYNVYDEDQGEYPYYGVKVPPELQNLTMAEKVTYLFIKFCSVVLLNMRVV